MSAAAFDNLVAELLEGLPLEAKVAPAAPAPEDRAGGPRDRVRGMLFGVALGDALGAPHEFPNQVPLERYTGSVVHPIRHLSRARGASTSALGQITDDTEMTIALADAILAAHHRGEAYQARDAVPHYLVWANSPCPFMGRTTRALFRGVKTVRGYQDRYAALHCDPAQWSQSNGCLMRCSPLAVLGDPDLAAADCALSNPHSACVGSVRAYVCAAHALLAGRSGAEATDAALASVATRDARAVIEAARGGERRAVCDPGTKGWVLHALYCAFAALNRPGTFQSRIDEVVRLGGDTDTNAAIAGGLLGAQVGAARMEGESRTGPNLRAVLTVDPAAGGLPRPATYAASRLPAIADGLARLFSD